MKKFFALMLALVMVLSFAAVAEESVEASEFEGSTETPDLDLSTWVEVDLTDINTCFYVPGDMTALDLDETAGQVWGAANADLSLYISVVSGESAIEDVDAALTDAGLVISETNVVELGYDHQEISNPEDENYGGILFQGADGNYYIFEAEDLAGDGTGAYTFGAILSTLGDMATESVEG